MKVGILGTGDVGKALGKGFVALGHDVMMGAREVGNAKAAAWAKEMGAKASAGTFADAAAFGEVVVLATLGSANEAVLRAAGDALAGKVLIDTTNPLDPASKLPRLSVGHTDSGGEQVQRAAPKARVVKAFNSVGNPHMFKPGFQGGPPSMFICGEDDAAKKQVAGLLEAFGWASIDIGGIEGSRYLEPLCIVWCWHGVKSGGWNHAFKMLHK